MSENIIPDENLPIYLQNYTVNVFCYEKLYNEEETCDSEPYGCCPDGVTSKDSPLGNNCIPECGSSKYSTVGIFPSNKTQKRVWNFKLAGKFQPHEGNYVIQYNFQKVDYQDISVTFENLLSGNLNVCGRILNMSDCSYYRFYPKAKILQIVIQSDKWQFYIKRETYFYMDILINDSLTLCNKSTSILVMSNNINTIYMNVPRGEITESIDFTLPTLAFPNGIDPCICSEEENCNSACCADIYVPSVGVLTLPNPTNNAILSLNKYLTKFKCVPQPSPTFNDTECIASNCNILNYLIFEPSIILNGFNIKTNYPVSTECPPNPSNTPSPEQQYAIIDASTLYLYINDILTTSYPITLNGKFFVNLRNVNFGSFKILKIAFNKKCFYYEGSNEAGNINNFDIIINGQTLNATDNPTWVPNRVTTLDYDITENNLSASKEYIISCQKITSLLPSIKSLDSIFSEVEFFGTGSSTEKIIFLELVDTATQENPERNLELEISVDGQVSTITTSFPQTKSNGYNEPTEPTTSPSSTTTPFTIGKQYVYSYDLSSILETSSEIYLIYYVTYSLTNGVYYPFSLFYTYCTDNPTNCQQLVSSSCIFTCSSCS